MVHDSAASPASSIFVPGWRTSKLGARRERRHSEARHLIALVRFSVVRSVHVASTSADTPTPITSGQCGRLGVVSLGARLYAASAGTPMPVTYGHFFLLKKKTPAPDPPKSKHTYFGTAPSDPLRSLSTQRSTAWVRSMSSSLIRTCLGIYQCSGGYPARLPHRALEYSLCGSISIFEFLFSFLFLEGLSSVFRFNRVYFPK